MEILYLSDQMVVCVKPVGLDAEKELPEDLKKGLGGEIYPVHRLDKNVGGIMIYARTRSAARDLSAVISQGKMVKEYVALVHGAVPERGDWEDLLFKDCRKNKVYVVTRERTGVKKARLEFWRLRTGDPALVRIRLHTGRSHQIRVQFSSRGFPLVGDHKYGARDKEAAPRLFSCALSFSFQGKDYRFEKLPLWGESV